jgi:hypothetical protein
MATTPCAPEDARPHVDDGTCGKCRKKFEQGHRVVISYIVDRQGNDPMDLGRRGLFLYEEYEFTHVDCRDPLLKKGLTNV